MNPKPMACLSFAALGLTIGCNESWQDWSGPGGWQVRQGPYDCSAFQERGLVLRTRVTNNVEALTFYSKRKAILDPEGFSYIHVGFLYQNGDGRYFTEARPFLVTPDRSDVFSYTTTMNTEILGELENAEIISFHDQEKELLEAFPTSNSDSALKALQRCADHL